MSPPGEGQMRWLRSGGEQGRPVLQCGGPTVCLWKLGTCWQLPPQLARLPWSQG